MCYLKTLILFMSTTSAAATTASSTTPLHHKASTLRVASWKSASLSRRRDARCLLPCSCFVSYQGGGSRRLLKKERLQRQHLRKRTPVCDVVSLLNSENDGFQVAEESSDATILPTTSSASSFHVESLSVDDKDFKESPLQAKGEGATTLNGSTQPSKEKKAFLSRFLSDLDRTILTTAIPSMINLAVVPLVNSVDTFWVGRMGNALALAGQAAANQAFFTLYFLISFLPTITAPLVATAVSSGDVEAARKRVAESLFLSNVLGGLGTIFLAGFPRLPLRLVLAPDAPAMDYATSYLRLRTLSMVPALISASGFAAYRGLLDTVTPLKVSLATNTINLVADPLLIFGIRCKGALGAAGAALATAGAETASGFTYLRLLLRKRLISWASLLKAPALSDLLPLLRGGFAMLLRQAAINVALLSCARRAQAIDPASGVAAAAYGIVMQIDSVGVVVQVAVQSTAATLVSSARAKEGDAAAFRVSNRMYWWGCWTGVALGLVQWMALPVLVPLFSTLPQVRQAVRLPALTASLIQALDGPVFVGEGILMGLNSFGALAAITAMGVAVLLGALQILVKPTTTSLVRILLSLSTLSIFEIGALWYHYRYLSPLAPQHKRAATTTT